jgi:hypothetical protein
MKYFLVYLLLFIPVICFGQTNSTDFFSDDATRQAQEIKEYIETLVDQGLSQDEIQQELINYFGELFGTGVTETSNSSSNQSNSAQGVNDTSNNTGNSNNQTNSGNQSNSNNPDQDQQNISGNNSSQVISVGNYNNLPSAGGIIEDEFYTLGYQDYLKSINYEKYIEQYLQKENLIILSNKDKFPVVAILSYGFIPYYDDTFDHIFVNSGEIDNDNIDNDGDGIIDNIILTSFKNRNDEYLSNIRDLDFSLVNQNISEFVNNYPGFISQIILGSDLDTDNYAGLLPNKELKIMLIDITDKNKNPVYLQNALEYILKLKKKHNIVAAVTALPSNTNIQNVNYTTLYNLQKAGIEYINDYNYKYFKLSDKICLNKAVCIQSKIVPQSVIAGIYANLKLNCMSCSFKEMSILLNKKQKSTIDMTQILTIENSENFEGLGYSIF